MKIYDLTVNYLKDPCGVDENPRFSYKISSDHRADHQKTRRIRVFSSAEALYAGNADVWDSGIIEDKNNVLIPYEGKKLTPVTRYYFTVEAENAYGEKAVSEAGHFVTGKLGTKWTAKWISIWKANKMTESAHYIRKTFTLEKEVKEAYLSICGLGYFESFVNGEKTGDDILSPAFTRYDEESFYMQYDVADKLKKGKNAIGVSLGNGWYNCFTEDRMWNTTAATWRNWCKMLCELKITYADGTNETLVSDTSWKASFGPITFTGVRNGEFYDARLELGDWTDADYDD